MNREGASVRRSPLPWVQFVYAAVFAVLVVAGLYCGYLAYETIREFAAHTQFASIPIFLAPTAQSPQTQARPEQPVVHPSAPQRNVLVPSIESKERVNILFLGIDQRPGQSVASRTDTMMLVSINPKDMSVSILSIPRDLWVEIPYPGHEKDRINTAHYWGEVENYPGGGPALAMKTVEYNFGVYVHYYARLNFVGFERVIDSIGGIDIDVPVTIDDNKYPGEDNTYTYLHIPAGPNHFDGDMALKYARTRRGTGDGDFSRMERQQQVILAIRDKALSLKNLPQLIFQMPKLVREMGDSLETNMPIETMWGLADWAQQIERDNIRMATIDREMTTDWRTPKGEMVLLYDRARARPVIDALFGDPTPEAQITQTSPAARLETEAARVVVYNGASADELASNVVSFLAMQGIDVSQTDDADRAEYEHTLIQVHAEKPYTTQWLIGWLADMGMSDLVVEHPIAQSDADIVLVIGKDFPADKFD